MILDSLCLLQYTFLLMHASQVLFHFLAFNKKGFWLFSPSDAAAFLLLLFLQAIQNVPQKNWNFQRKKWEIQEKGNNNWGEAHPHTHTKQKYVHIHTCNYLLYLQALLFNIIRCWLFYRYIHGFRRFTLYANYDIKKVILLWYQYESYWWFILLLYLCTFPHEISLTFSLICSFNSYLLKA